MGANLTTAVFEVLELAANGHTITTTATRRRTSRETVKSQRRQAIAALDAEGMTHAVALALVHGVTVRNTPRQLHIDRSLEPASQARQEPARELVHG